MANSMGLPKHWWRGNLHAHSLWSDGDEFPEVVVERYKHLGYHFLALTEHNRLARGAQWLACTDPRLRSKRLEDYRQRFGQDWVQAYEGRDGQKVRLKPIDEYRHLFEEPARFMLMTGEEITIETPGRSSSFVDLWNARRALKPIVCDSKREGLQRVVDTAYKRSAGTPLGLHLNHPNWQWNCTAEEIAPLDRLRFVEVFTALNSCNCHGDASRPSTERIWDIVLSLRLARFAKPLIYGLATDDAHLYDDPASTAGRAWVMVRAAYLTPENIIGAMQAGDFYASSGVVLADLDAHAGRIALRIKTEPGVSYCTEFVGTSDDTDVTPEPPIDVESLPPLTTRSYSQDVGRVLARVEGAHAAYDCSGNELFVRARIVSSKPHPLPHRPGDVEMAWTQPVIPN